MPANPKDKLFSSSASWNVHWLFEGHALKHHSKQNINFQISPIINNDQTFTKLNTNSADPPRPRPLQPSLTLHSIADRGSLPGDS